MERPGKGLQRVIKMQHLLGGEIALLPTRQVREDAQDTHKKIGNTYRKKNPRAS